MENIEGRNWQRWREMICDSFVHLECRTEARNFYGNIRKEISNSDRICSVVSTQQRTCRTAASIREYPSEEFLLLLQRTGKGAVSQAGRRAELLAGDFVVCDTSEPYELCFDAPFEQVVLKLSRVKLERTLPECHRYVGQTIRGNTGPGSIVSSFIQQLTHRDVPISENDLSHFDDSLVDMVTTAMRVGINGTLNRSESRLAEIKNTILKQIRDPQLDIHEIAHHAGMSPRTLNRLFHTEGETPHEWVKKQRYSAVAAELAESHQRSITDIAYSWGFNDLSSFSRGFKSRFGKSASQWRTNYE